MNKNSSSFGFLRQRRMESVTVCLVLLALSAVQYHAAMPTSTFWVRVGEDAMLQCPLLDGSSNTTVTVASETPAIISWYRMAAGQGPKLLLSLGYINGSYVKYGDGVAPSKISAMTNGSLLLRSSEQSDAAVYYCGISHGSEHKGGPDPKTYTGN